LTFFRSASAGSEAKELKVKIERDVPVRMRDGTILRADVHRPDRGGPYPVLVRRTPYGKGKWNFDRLVEAGYIVMSQDVRGRYKSEGKWESYWRHNTHDSVDGYDTVEWAAGLSGSNGKVGTFGGSYDAFLQWRLAPLRPPSLMCMSAYTGGAAKFADIQGPSGIRPAIGPLWLDTMATDMQRRENLPGVHMDWEALRLAQKDRQKWINWLPWLELPDDFFGYETHILREWLKNPHVDPWRLDEGVKDISAPNLDITGWYDHGLGDMLLFRLMVEEAKTDVARSGTRIIIGPWGHTRPARSFGNIDFGPDALLDRTALQIRWFDHWLKGSENGVENDPPLKIFIMGDNRWRDEQQWPLRRTKEKVLYITSDGHANTPNGNGRLVAERTQSVGTDDYEYDPINPVPTPHKRWRPRACDQRPLAKREDILVYQTEPLSERLEVTGNPVVELYALSSAPDTDWFVRLIDVHPDGLARDVCMGMVRARYRDIQLKPELLTPGEVVKYTIRMRPTSNAFLPGHRIRLDITSSDFPWYDRNHNTAANQNADATLVVAKQTIYHGGEHPTRIILPWIPNPKEEEGSTEKAKLQQQPLAYQLHQAAADGSTEQIKLFLSKGTDVNTKDKELKTPLHHAAEKGQTEVVRLLVEAGANVHAVDKDGVTSLHTAAKLGNKEVVETLIANDAETDSEDKWLWSPLHYAAWKGHRDVAELLISEGAEVNAKDDSGFSPLHYAAQYGYKDVVELLITRDTDINAKDNDGITPLGHALIWGHRDIAGLLFAQITVFSSKDYRGLTALHSAAVEGYADIAELLLAKGAKVDERDDNYEFTALHYAARFGTTKVAEVLIVHGADIEAKDQWDYQPIHWAAYHDRPEIIELLIAKGADVNAETSLGQTPLELAKPRRNTVAIEVLHKHGAKEVTREAVITPEVYPHALRNPLKGFRPGTSPRAFKHEYVTLTRCYLRWNELENDETDTIDKIKKVCDEKWMDVEKHNIKIIPRVYLDWDRKKGNEYWPADMQTGDYSSEQFKRRVIRLAQRLGQCWDNDPRVAWVQLGIIGYWGEHHNPSPDDEMQKLLGDAFTGAFTNKKVTVRHPWEFTDYEFGVYWDSWGHIQQVRTHGEGIAKLNAAHSRWAISPMGGECAYNWGRYGQQPGDNPNDTLRDPSHLNWLLYTIRWLHCSNLGWVANYDASDPQVQQGAEQVQKALGYRFILDKVCYPARISSDKAFTVSFLVRNIGSAPFYYNWPVEVSLLDPKTRIPVWRDMFQDLDIRRWLPGDRWNKTTKSYELRPKGYRVNGTFQVPQTVGSDEYILALAILDPAGMLPSTRFAIENYFEGGRHPIGLVGVGKLVREPVLDPASFDDPAEDKTLKYTLDNRYTLAESPEPPLSPQEAAATGNADVNAKGTEGETPLSMPKDEGHTEIVKLLRKHQAKE
jgi:putative CocE/NonD family hydrolase